MRAEDLFDERAQDAIERAVQAAELRSAGEIVAMVVDRSHDYAGIRAIAAALLAFAVGVVMLAGPLDPGLWLPPGQLVVFVAGYWVTGWRGILRWLVPARRAAAFVDQAAGVAFLQHGLVETRDRTGILIYLSLLEHRVEVLADRGIDCCVEDGTWDGVVRLVLDGIRARRAEEGLCEAITLCGDILATQFPPRPDDEDELPNRVRL